MLLALIIYLIDILSFVKLASLFVAVISLIGISMVFAFGGKSYKAWVKTLIVAVVLSIFVPREKTAYMMVGAYATQEIATAVSESEEVKNIGNNILKIIDGKLESMVNTEGK